MEITFKDLFKRLVGARIVSVSSKKESAVIEYKVQLSAKEFEELEKLAEGEEPKHPP